MRVRLVRRPGQHGTKEYLQAYGDRLICVRYRYDAAAKRRYKTIEIIVDEAPWAPRGGTSRADLPDPGVDIAAAADMRGGKPSDRPPAEPRHPATAQPPTLSRPTEPRHATAAQPSAPSHPTEARRPATRRRFDSATLVGIRLPAGRPELVSLIQQADGAYHTLLGVWIIRYDRASTLGLTKFIVDSVESLAAAWNSQASPRSSRQ